MGAVSKFKVRPIEPSEARPLVEKFHYSKSLNGVNTKHCFGLFDGDSLIGAAVYAGLGMANAWKKYAKRMDDVLELRRLVCTDEAPKYSESRLIGKSLQWLRKFTHVQRVVSYADKNQGHIGIIYKATNFTLVGQTSPGKVIIHNGKKYHDKAIRDAYGGKYKPYALRLREALEKGDAVYMRQEPKNIYVYELRGGDRPFYRGQ